MRTRFTELFGLRYPIISAPMAMHSGARLAAAVSEGGGLGSFGAMNFDQGADWVRAQMDAVRAQTERPFAVGFITHLIGLMPQIFDVVIDDPPSVIAFSFDDPRPWIDRAKATGATIMCQVQTMELAQVAVDAGADILVAQGTDAGGHTGIEAGLPFLSRVVDTYPDMPVLAAGGIADGRTLASVLAAGADGAWLGTAFLATPESEVRDEHRQLIVASDGNDTVFSKVYDIISGVSWPDPIGVRTRANAFTARWHGREEELRRRRPEVVTEWLASVESFDPEESAVPYGTASGLIDAVRPAAEVVRAIGESAELILRERAKSLLG